MQVFVTIGKVGIKINVGANVKNWLIKVYARKDLFGILVIVCVCECDKSCDVGEYLDYDNCKCRKKLVDELVEECTENIEEVKLAKITSTEDKSKHKCSSLHTVHCVTFNNFYCQHWNWYLFCLLQIHE